MDKELLDKQINDLDALLDMVGNDWNTDIVQSDIMWFAQLINKTRSLKDEYQNQRSKLVGQTSQE